MPGWVRGLAESPDDREHLDGADGHTERVAAVDAAGSAGQVPLARSESKAFCIHAVEFLLQPSRQVVQPATAPARIEGHVGQAEPRAWAASRTASRRRRAATFYPSRRSGRGRQGDGEPGTGSKPAIDRDGALVRFHEALTMASPSPAPASAVSASAVSAASEETLEDVFDPCRGSSPLPSVSHPELSRGPGSFSPDGDDLLLSVCCTAFWTRLRKT